MQHGRQCVRPIHERSKTSRGCHDSARGATGGVPRFVVRWRARRIKHVAKPAEVAPRAAQQAFRGGWLMWMLPT
jgi:hypothetical protein